MRFENTYEEQNSMPDCFRMVPKLGYGETMRSLRFLKKQFACGKNGNLSRCPDREAAPAFQICVLCCVCVAVGGRGPQ